MLLGIEVWVVALAVLGYVVSREVVTGVVQGLARTDLLAVEKAATASGMAAAVDPQLEKKLPRQFLDLGERTHHGLCHAIYRLGDTR